MYSLSDYDYDLPDQVIAQTPIKPRDSAKMMVLDRRKQTITHSRINCLADFLEAGDLLVFNDSKVLPVRIQAMKKDTGGLVEILFLRQLAHSLDSNHNFTDIWQVLLRPLKRLKIGQSLVLTANSSIKFMVTDIDADQLKLQYTGKQNLHEILHKYGKLPLPPYIKKGLSRPSQYQTIYANHDGSVAAPTAGLHFTHRLFNKLEKALLGKSFLTLHVGIGTFIPVRSLDIRQHQLHSELVSISPETKLSIEATRSSGRRIVAVGTTSARALESFCLGSQLLSPEHSSYFTDIFIYPGYNFQKVDALLTNFHLPKSSLLMLVSAFAGYEFMMKAYLEALKNNYRFFSFGDAMLIL